MSRAESVRRSGGTGAMLGGTRVAASELPSGAGPVADAICVLPPPVRTGSGSKGRRPEFQIQPASQPGRTGLPRFVHPTPMDR